MLWIIKTIPKPQELYRAGIAPPGSQIPRSTTGLDLFDVGQRRQTKKKNVLSFKIQTCRIEPTQREAVIEAETLEFVRRYSYT